MADSDLVYHLAGISELGYADPIRMEMVNVAGTRKVLTLANQLGVPRIIFMSSLAVNGDTRGVLATEAYQPGRPLFDRSGSNEVVGALSGCQAAYRKGGAHHHSDAWRHLRAWRYDGPDAGDGPLLLWHHALYSGAVFDL